MAVFFGPRRGQSLVPSNTRPGRINQRAGGTRTCIHTPAEPLGEREIPDAHIAAALDGAALVFFDGRLAEAALHVARAARWAALLP